MTTRSSVLAWRIPWTEEPGRLQSMGCKESNMTEQLTLSFQIYRIRNSGGGPNICYLRNTFQCFWCMLAKASGFQTWLHIGII